MKDISDSCAVGDHVDCDGMVYNESNGMAEVRGQCNCGCHYRARNNGSTPQEWKTYQARIKQAEEAVQ